LVLKVNRYYHVDTGMHIYTEPLLENLSLSGRPVFINGLDL
jgi:hypothetical protein